MEKSVAETRPDVRNLDDAADAMSGCPRCGRHVVPEALKAALMVCPMCGYHHALGALQRIAQLADAGSWEDVASDVRPGDPLEFVDLRPYPDRLRSAQVATGLVEAFVAGRCRIEGLPVALGVLDFGFLGGSMGAVVGEVFWRLVQRSITDGVPLVVVTASGGARMQEGLISLVQMAKTVVALEVLRDTHLPFVAVLSNPTTGGVLASFASLADVIVAEPGAQLWFTGPRVRELTTHEHTPDGFGTAEEALECGHIDMVAPRGELRQRLVDLLILLQGGESAIGEAIPQRRAPFRRRAGALGRALERTTGLARALRRWVRGGDY